MCVFLGPRLRQHHSHHQKPSVERHWDASWGKPNREKHQWLSAPVCQGRNVWNQTETQRTRPWTDPPPLLVKYGSIFPPAPPHISSPSFIPLPWRVHVSGRVGLYSNIYTARSQILLVHSSPNTPPPQLIRSVSYGNPLNSCDPAVLTHSHTILSKFQFNQLISNTKLDHGVKENSHWRLRMDNRKCQDCKTFAYLRRKKSRNSSIYFVLPIKEALRHTVSTDG